MNVEEKNLNNVKVIEVDLEDRYDFVEKYNHDKVSLNLLDYLIKETKYVDKKTDIEIIITPEFANTLDLGTMLKNAIQEEYYNTVQDHYFNNIFQIVLFLLGIIFLSISTLIKKEVVWKEIFLIGGWVPIWEMIELELFNDIRGRKRKAILKKLCNSKIIVQKPNINK